MTAQILDDTTVERLAADADRNWMRWSDERGVVMWVDDDEDWVVAISRFEAKIIVVPTHSPDAIHHVDYDDIDAGVTLATLATHSPSDFVEFVESDGELTAVAYVQDAGERGESE